MQTVTHRFHRATWMHGQMCSALANLKRRLRLDVTAVRFDRQPEWHTENEIEDLYEVTQLPPDDGGISVQFVRRNIAEDSVSNLDVMSLSVLAADTISLVFRATESHYEIDATSNGTDVAGTVLEVLEILADELALTKSE